MQGFISDSWKKMYFCFWKDNILLFSLPTVMSKTAPVNSYHTCFSSLFLLCLVVNLKIIGAYFSHPLSWRSLWDGYIWWAENQEFLLPSSVLYLWHCSCRCTSRRRETGVSRNIDTRACLFWFAIEVARDSSRWTGTCKGPGNTGPWYGWKFKLPFMPSCHSSYICCPDGLPTFLPLFILQWFYFFIFRPLHFHWIQATQE